MFMKWLPLFARAEFQRTPCSSETEELRRFCKIMPDCTNWDFMPAMKYAKHWHNTSVGKEGSVGLHGERNEHNSFQVFSKIWRAIIQYILAYILQKYWLASGIANCRCAVTCKSVWSSQARVHFVCCDNEPAIITDTVWVSCLKYFESQCYSENSSLKNSNLLAYKSE